MATESLFFLDPSDLPRSESSLREPGYRARAIFVVADRPRGEVLNAIRIAHLLQPGAPILLAFDGSSEAVPPREQRFLGVHGAVSRPKTNDDAEKALLALRDGPDEGDASPLIEARPERAGKPVSLDDFVEIPLHALPAGVRSFFDLYLRLPDDKFVCIVRAGDTLAEERAESYRRKGLNALYLPRETRDQFVRSCELALRHEEQLVARAVADPSVSDAEKVSKVLHLGDETLRYLRAIGLGDAQLKPATRFVEQVTALTRRLSGAHPILEALLRDIETAEHGAGAAMVGALLAQAIGVTNEAELNAIGVACLLHDISMIHQPEAVRSEDPARMTDAQKTQYLQHPAASATILAKIGELPPSVARMAAEHHMRRTNDGFPSRRASDRAHLDSEIVGMADELVRLISQASKDPSLDAIEAMRELAAQSFSPDATAALTKAFVSAREPAR